MNVIRGVEPVRRMTGSFGGSLYVISNVLTAHTSLRSLNLDHDDSSRNRLSSHFTQGRIMSICSVRRAVACWIRAASAVLIILGSGTVPVLAQVELIDTIDGKVPIQRPALDLIGKIGDQAIPPNGSEHKPPVPEFLPRPSAKEQSILDALNQPMEVALRDNDLPSALEYLKELHSIEIWVDSAQINAGEITVTLEAREISLRSCLNLLLVPRGMAYLVEDDVLKITTREVAELTFVTRTYPAADLFETLEEADELTEVLECGLGLPLDEGARRSLKISLKSRAIVARQTHQTHDRLLQILRDLRNARGDQVPGALVLNLGYKRDRLGAKISDVPVVFYHDKSVDLEELDPSLEREKHSLVARYGAENLANIVVMIRADPELPSKTVQQLIKTCQDVGYCKFSLRVMDAE